MRNHRAMGKDAKVVLAAVGFLMALAAPSAAQRDRAARIERRVEQIERQRQEYERETLGKDGKPTRPADRKQAQAAAAQVKNDFERIQVVYNEIVMTLPNDGRGLDYKFISEAASEVKKLASRLKSSLLLPEPPPDEQAAEKPSDDMKASLIALCKRIHSFVTNPLFESDGALNIDMSKRANRDLIKIIEFSDHIKKTADHTARPQH